MILVPTKLTGYSLGLPLWWPDDPSKISTGCIQGINITLAASTPLNVYLTSYKKAGNTVSMTFSTDSGILCSLATELFGEPSVHVLEGASRDFISGWVALYAITGYEELELSGAQINPKYIQYTRVADEGGETLTLISKDSGGVIDSKIGYNTAVIPVDSVDVRMTRLTNDGAIHYIGTTKRTTNAVVESTGGLIYYINGSPISGGSCTLNLPEGWTVAGNSFCAKIANPSDTGSCPDDNYIEQELSPANFSIEENPLSIAFSGGVLVMDEVYAHRFNTEYETGADGSAGLAWNSFSSKHDVWIEENAN